MSFGQRKFGAVLVTQSAITLMRTRHLLHGFIAMASVAALLSCAADSSTSDSRTGVSAGLTGKWQSPPEQLPRLNVEFTAENAASGSGGLTVAPTSPEQGPSTPQYTGDSLTITSGSNNGSAVTFSGSLGRNPVGNGTFYTGVISFAGTLSGGTLSGTLNYTPPRTATQIFAARTATGLVLTKGK